MISELFKDSELPCFANVGGEASQLRHSSVAWVRLGSLTSYCRRRSFPASPFHRRIGQAGKPDLLLQEAKLPCFANVYTKKRQAWQSLI